MSLETTNLLETVLPTLTVKRILLRVACCACLMIVKWGKGVGVGVWGFFYILLGFIYLDILITFFKR